MNRRDFIKYTAMSIPVIYAAPLMANISLGSSQAGRIGFYIDYSELSAPGEHIFYVTRTHGFRGEVTVNYSTHGDGHKTQNGALTWADGDFDVKSFSVVVDNKNSGEHRIYAKLSNPTGGAVLHNGEFTKAYGVIDDNSVHDDANAVFYDSEAPDDGDGSRLKPYNNVYTALASVGTKKYFYGRGTTVPDGTNKIKPNGGGGEVDCIFMPEGRKSDDERLILRNWPGHEWIITGNSSNHKIGFYSDGGLRTPESNYVSFKGIKFYNLDSTRVKSTECGGINYFKNGGVSINIESCSFENINGSTNTSGFNAYGVNGAKIWRSKANNVAVRGDLSNQNASGLCVFYGSSNMSFQRCEVSDTYVGLHFKRPSKGNISPVVRFCKIKDTFKGIKYGFGTTNQEVNFTCIQSNLFKNCRRYMAIEVTGASPNALGNNQINNNIFDNCGEGDNGAIYIKDAYEFKIFNNIFVNCRKTWDVPEPIEYQTNKEREVLLFADFNHDFATSLVRYEYLGEYYRKSAALSAAFPHLASQDTTGEISFGDPENDDYSFATMSTSVASGYEGTVKGIYMTGIERLGISDSAQVNVPKPPTDVRVN